ncbi:ferric-mycobactin receptor FemA [Oxalicibacterium flavum]|uniref:Ferric-mycobactin receptor FemA n=1 Tax=Oxalicibacterium flavum TaxID=179467 RepID=A0A8J2UNU9_9BURK|nr:TonB-dependent receptor [Oxalicibacterium flavum]GGC08586.1 ferric-mycobactin receptor FemA [Oxalicibacterium flavum]
MKPEPSIFRRPFRLRAKPLALLIHAALSGMVLLTISGIPTPAWSQSIVERKTYDLPADALEDALNRFSRQAGITLSFDPALVQGRSAPALKGTYSLQEGLDALLRNSQLQATQAENGSFGLRVLPAATNSETTLPAVSVMAGSHADDLPPAYTGGQVARGARLGMLGNVDVMNMPFSVTAYTSELIRNQQAHSLTDVLDNTPGVSSGGPWFFDNFIIRGFEYQRSEIGFNGLYGIASVEGVQLEGIERVEVLKGPSTLLNGSSPRGTAGGSINLVPKRADDAPLNRVTANYLSDGNLGAHVDIGRRFGRDNAFGIRLNAAHRDGDSAVDHEKQRISNATLGLDYRGERLRASADVGASTQKISGARNNYFVWTPTVPEAPRGDINPYPDWSYQDKNYVFGMARAEFDLTSSWSIGGAVGMAETRRKANSPWGEIINDAGDIAFSAFGIRERNKTHSGELNTRFNLETGPVKHTVVLAATEYNSKVSAYNPTSAWGDNSNIYHPARLSEPGDMSFDGSLLPQNDVNLRSYAITNTLSMLDERLLLTLGLRHQKIDVTSYVWNTGAWQSNYNRSANTPALGLVVKPVDKLSIYVNYVEALSQGAVAPSTANNPGEVFAPFVSKQWEVGAKVDWGTFTTTLSAFEIKRPSGFLDTDNFYRLAGEQRNRGVELSMFGEAARGLRLLGGAAWTRAILTDTPGGRFNGARAFGIPTWSVKLGSEYDIRQVPGLTSIARVIYSSSMPYDAANTETIPSWTRFDLGARYAARIASHPVLFRATVENVFNRRYWDSSPAYQMVTSAAPRTYMLSASIDF